MRSYDGCWTCRLRRKKCDERHPVCDGCASLHIACHYSQEKPQWMDGGVKQEEMAEKVKREVKEKASDRREGRAIHSSDRGSGSNSASSPSTVQSQRYSTDSPNHPCDILRARANLLHNQLRSDCTLTSKKALDTITFGRSDTVLLAFYLEHLLPFLFPFYNPSLLLGGKSWILEMMISSPVVRQATLCQSSYFYSLALETANADVVWELVLIQTREALGVLRQSLQAIDGLGIAEHLHGSVRIMASIMQIQRFELAILSFENCRSHLQAATALFTQLLDTSRVLGSGDTKSCFESVVARLGPATTLSSSQYPKIPSAEESAFRFSSALLLFDDIIASTVIQQRPGLHDYHDGLLRADNDAKPVIDLEAIVGIQNWVLLHISDIAILDTWKQQREAASSFDVMELVHRTTSIKTSLESDLARLESIAFAASEEHNSLSDVFSSAYSQRSTRAAAQSIIVTRVWAHAALLYLNVVASGMQPANEDIRYHVSRVLELLEYCISPPALVRTMVWPFCVAGCLAEPIQQCRFRRLAQDPQPANVFGTLRKALQIMENVWRSRDGSDSTNRDIAMCFKSHGYLVLLV